MTLNSNKIFQYLPLTHTRATFRLVTKLHKHKVTSILDLEDSACLLYTSPSPRDVEESRMPSSA